MTITEGISPFRIDVPPSDPDDLIERLRRTRFGAPLPGDGWDTGIPVAYLRELVDYWLDSYDWRTHEAALNEYPQSQRRSTGRPFTSCTCAPPNPAPCRWC